MREVQLEDEPLELEDGNDSPVDYEKGMADYYNDPEDNDKGFADENDDNDQAAGRQW